ncbi:hypothetical protein BBBOND_0311760 [Babesia bigemina]|uniref:6-Cys domain-containing protein n=1 Tax=Babesia bigemina TaxID=5866 RepID=A0A061D9S5_BABBI|nr:hypothetical protein BBBOND_0311760 [Babesia bigemina]CDR97273.1 hypothetical protein BBBOND_0311760 [Babesia bigemina]|eukprot:XP_012769459.1 hypothetical protein BBBOND_0311760 [Babesia bigemina]
MGISALINAVLAFCAIWLHRGGFIYASEYNFDYQGELLVNNAVVRCRMDIAYPLKETVICPIYVEGTEYVWHPRPNSNEDGDVNSYVSNNGKLRSIPLSNVLLSEAENPLIWLVSNDTSTELRLDFSANELFASTERRLIFICGPKDLVLNAELQRQLHRLDDFDGMQELPWTQETPLTQEIAKIGHGLGVFYLDRGRMDRPLQGCGSRPSPLFDAENEVSIDRKTGAVSCVADPMSESRIGFLCEGWIDPPNCMKYLINNNDEIVTAYPPNAYLNFEESKPWVVARYFINFALPPFHGECRCINPETGAVMAKMKIRRKTEYVCDIASMMLRNRVRPIRGPWCSVVLHPGSTLTIRLPAPVVNSSSIDEQNEGDDDGDIEEDAITVPFSQLPSVYEYETEFLPKDMTTLRQIKSLRDIDHYDEVAYDQALAGDALELDASQISRGEVKLKYRSDKPLALKGGLNSFLYHWKLVSKSENVANETRAVVNVSFALTHHYDIIGSDLGEPSVFDPDRSKDGCSTKPMGNGLGGTYECVNDMSTTDEHFGIHCRPDEELLPGNCASTGYDLYSNSIRPFPRSIRNVTPYPTVGFRVLRMGFINRPLSYACVCVDRSGYETSRLVLASNRKIVNDYVVRRAGESHTPLPYMLLPWSEGVPSSDKIDSPMYLVIYHAPEKTIKMQMGTTLHMTCAFDSELQNDVNTENLETTWLPMPPEEFYYKINEVTDGLELNREKYADSICSTHSALEVVYQTDPKSNEHKQLTIRTSRSAILISKDPISSEHVRMNFVCGKKAEPLDLSSISGDALSADESEPIVSSIIDASEKYTWNVVKVQLETTDPYMQGCGFTYESDELFKPETPEIYDANGQQIGCKIDIQAAGEAAFYCPAPYVLDPPGCFDQVYVDGEEKNVRDISQSLGASRSNHFVTLKFYGKVVGPGETLRKTPPLECRCVTIKGIVLSTIQIENYYAKE